MGKYKNGETKILKNGNYIFRFNFDRKFSQNKFKLQENEEDDVIFILV